MSVIGIDFGAGFSVVAATQRRGIDIVANEASRRKTPSLVGFGSDRRYCGESAQTQRARNVRNTVAYVKDFLGQKYADMSARAAAPYYPFRVVETAGGELGMAVTLRGEEIVASPTEVAGMMLQELKRVTETALSTTIRDVVVAVPSFYGDPERRALMDAARIVGLNPLALLNDNAAAALSWGFYRDFEEGAPPTMVMFFDMGETSLQVSVVKFTKNRADVVGAAFDASCGGRDFDMMLFEHLADEIAERYKLDVRGNARASLRLLAACEKLKTVLSANPVSPVHVESLLNDVDVSAHVERSLMEEKAGALLERVTATVQRALAAAGIEPSALAAVEAIGGASRIPCVASAVAAVLGREMGRTLNAEEAVAKGCALQCAMLSPTVQVRQFMVHDAVSFPISAVHEPLGAVAMDDAAAAAAVDLFHAGDATPSAKVVTYRNCEPFAVTLRAAVGRDVVPGSPHAPGTVLTVGRYEVPVVEALADGSRPDVRVKVKYDRNGLVAVAFAHRIEPVAEGAAPEAVDGAPAKRKERTSSLAIKAKTAALDASALAAATKLEAARLAADNAVIAAAEERNKVESYVYSLRDRLSGELQAVATAAEAQAARDFCEATEDWLYDEGEDAELPVYQKRLAELERMGSPLEKRLREREERPRAMAQFEAYVKDLAAILDAPGERYGHIAAEELAKVRAKLDTVAADIRARVATQDAAPATADPQVLASDVLHAKENIDRVARPVLATPKPAPPKEEKAEDAEAPAAAEEAAAEGGEERAETPMEE